MQMRIPIVTNTEVNVEVLEAYDVERLDIRNGEPMRGTRVPSP